MAKLMGWAVGMAVFIAWISMVGNPHVVETAIGLGLAVAAGFWTYFKMSPKSPETRP